MPIPEQLKLTYDDYLNLPDDGNRYEIVDGELYMTPAPQTRHQIVSMNLETMLMRHIEETASGYILHAPTDVFLSSTTVVQPDILFIRKERAHIIKKNFIEGPPDLIIEILSPGNEPLDRDTKMKRYALFGVEEYWLVDYQARTLEQHLLTGRFYQREGVFTGDFSPAIFPDLHMDLSQIFKGPGFG